MNFSSKLFLLVFMIFAFGCEDTSEKTGASTPQAKSTSGTYKPTVQTTLGIVLPEKTVAQGESVCMDVSVKDFNKIVSIQHSLNWNPEVLKFEKVQNFNLKAMSIGSFGLTRVEQGNYAVSWYDPAVQGFSLGDGTKIYEVCFEVIGASGTESPVRITGKPVAIEVSTTDQRILGIPSGKGKITVK